MLQIPKWLVEQSRSLIEASRWSIKMSKADNVRTTALIAESRRILAQPITSIRSIAENPASTGRERSSSADLP
jgi:hypothetical protein